MRSVNDLPSCSGGRYPHGTSTSFHFLYLFRSTCSLLHLAKLVLVSLTFIFFYTLCGSLNPGFSFLAYGFRKLAADPYIFADPMPLPYELDCWLPPPPLTDRIILSRFQKIGFLFGFCLTAILLLFSRSWIFEYFSLGTLERKEGIIGAIRFYTPGGTAASVGFALALDESSFLSNFLTSVFAFLSSSSLDFASSCSS